MKMQFKISTKFEVKRLWLNIGGELEDGKLL